MRALAVGNDGMEVVERERPEPGLGEVVIDVNACGICGSDVHHLSRSKALLGRVIGHEFSGTIAELGDGVEVWRVGQHVAVNPLGSCGKCEACARGLIFLCQNVPNLGLSVPGGYAEHVSVPVGQLHALPDEIDVEIGSHAEPLAVALGAIDAAQPSPGDDALVVGVGPIGLSIVAGLRASGAGRIVAVGRSAGRRKAAAALGADVVLDARDTDFVDYATAEGLRFRQAYECSGSSEMIAKIAPVMAMKGTIVEVALPDDPGPVNFRLLVNRGLSVVGSCAFAPQNYRLAVELLASGAVDPEPIVSERVPLEDAPDAFVRMQTPGDLVGILVQPWR